MGEPIARGVMLFVIPMLLGLAQRLRLTSPEVAREILDAWFASEPDPGEAANIARLETP